MAGYIPHPSHVDPDRREGPDDPLSASESLSAAGNCGAGAGSVPDECAAGVESGTGIAVAAAGRFVAGSCGAGPETGAGLSIRLTGVATVGPCFAGCSCANTRATCTTTAAAYSRGRLDA